MTSCSNIEVTGVVGFGKAKTWNKALNRAMKDAEAKGQDLCKAGECSAFGTSCTYRLVEASVKIEVSGEGGGTRYHATAEQSGVCACA